MNWIIAALALSGAVLHAHPSAEHRLEELEEHLKETPGDVEMRISYATQLRKMKRYDDAEKALLTVETLSPGHQAAELERAQIAYYRNDDVKVAESLAVALTKAHPRYADAWGFLAQLQRKAEKTDDAIDSYRRYIALTPQYRAGDFTDLANLLIKRNGTNDREEAVQVLDQGIGKVGHLTGLHLMAADVEISLNRYEAAARRFDQLAARFRPRPDWAKRKGDIYMLAERYQDAADAYDSAIAIIRSMPKERQEGKEVIDLIAILTDAKKAAAAKAAQ